MERAHKQSRISPPEMTRRGLLGGGVVAALVASASIARSAQGAKVFLDYTQAELDHNYNQAAWAPNIKQILGRYSARSALTRSRLGEPETFAYGDGENETLDVFRTSASNAPIQIFVHGGAWRVGKADQYHFPAEMFTAAGAHYIAVDFSPVTEVGLDGMIDQLRRAVAWVHAHAPDFDADTGRIFVSGHSSGGHLAGCLVTTDWAGRHELPADVIKGAVLISGMYDLAPVRKSARSDYVPFTDKIEQDLSAMRNLDLLGCPVVVAHGDLETDEFQRHSRDFADAADKKGLLQKHIIAEANNHFEVFETFADAYGVIGYEALRQMKL